MPNLSIRVCFVVALLVSPASAARRMDITSSLQDESSRERERDDTSAAFSGMLNSDELRVLQAADLVENSLSNDTIYEMFIRGLRGLPDPGQSTNNGCKCKSSCGGLKCDSCLTVDRCGHRSLHGRWDYCVYPPDADFDAKGYQEKTDYIWGEIVKDQTSAPIPSLTGILFSPTQTSFDNMKEELPSGRKKHIHGIGSICKFDLQVSEKSPYTGLLGPGLQQGFIRMGNALPINIDGLDALTPGLGFKFLRTNAPSGNFVALHKLDPSFSWNFFKVNLSNHLPPAAGLTVKILVKKFREASQCPTQVGISDLARYSQDGTEHFPPKFPFKLFFVPGDEVQTPDTAKTVDQVHAEMGAFPVGTTLYTVYACGKAKGDEMNPTDSVETACGSPVKLGELVTTSECTTSQYGDTHFHVRHQRVEEDWKLNPDILDQYDAGAVCGGTVTPDGTPQKCADKA